MTAAERLARVGLARYGRPDAAQRILVAAHGIEAAWDAKRFALVTAGVAVTDPAEQLERAAETGVRFVMTGDAEWPSRLSALERFLAVRADAERRGSGRDLGPPLGLWVRGNPLAPVPWSVAVVGSRAATAYGTAVAGELGSGLAARGVEVVSGAAFGIDGAAHRGALAAHGRTVAVVAGGVDVAYPLAHEALLAVIAERGSIVSEAAPGDRPERGSFLRRNRLIAALTDGTVLVEAGLRSGARNTLAHAQELGRHRFVVPGPVTSRSSTGCHAALRADTDAVLVTGTADVLEVVGRMGDDLAAHPRGPGDTRDGLGERARALLDLLPPHEAWTADRLGAATGLGAREVLAICSALAGTGLLERSEEGWRLTALGRAPTTRGG
jgi:DNA processing protein